MASPPVNDLEAQTASIADAEPEIAPLNPRHSGPPRDQEWAESGMQRSSGSRRRKPAGQVHGSAFEYGKPPVAPMAPEAPEPPPAPRGPPISYRDPHVNGAANVRSFADRARDLAEEGTHLPSGRTPEPNVMAKDYVPFTQAIRPDFVEPQQADVYEDAGAGAPEVVLQQQAARMPFGESPTGNRRAARNDPNLDSENQAIQNARPQKVVSVRGKANPQKIDWAVDHSPLQRLEVKLEVLSKEEKRARVQAAEERARQRERARKEREAQASENQVAPDAQDRERKRSSIRSDADGPRQQARSIGQENASTDAPKRTQSGRRVVSGPQSPTMTQTKEQSDQQKASRIPRPVEATAALGAAGAVASLGRKSSQRERQRASLDSAGTRLLGDSNSLTRQYDGSKPAMATERRRSADDREVRFHPFDESISRNKAGPKVPRSDLPPQQAALYSERLEVADEPTPAHAVLAHKGGPKYEVPPQAPAAGKARQLLGFGGEQAQDSNLQSEPERHDRFLPHLHRHQQQAPTGAVPQTTRHLDEWRQAGTARLLLSDLHARREPPKSTEKNEKPLPWWESPISSQRRSSRASAQQPAEIEYFDGANEDTSQPTIFDPPLFAKCGPLLRYTGLKRDKLAPPAGEPARERETWRGSVMIVTLDSESVYEPAPTLRLFHQPMDLLPPPPTHVTEGDEAPSEYVDPVAGMPKIARDGSTLYVKPAEDFDEGADYSKDETDEGLFERTRTANVPTGYGRPDDGGGDSPTPQVNPATRRGISKGRFREVRGIRLHAERGVTFWRFNLEIELGDKQARIAYRINKGASVGFWVPARGQSMNIMFHSCNGFSHSVKPEEFGGPDPLWRDVLNSHQTKPFHVMIGGGDQIYNDRVTEDTTIFQQWLDIKNPLHKRSAPFNADMRDELEQFYLDRYSMWFSQGLFSMANSQIPMVNIWDDHDIIDGYGSYPHSFMASPVFCGLGSVAFKYYMLFQHQSVPDELEADEPSWLLGPSPGPYINFVSRSLFLSLGKSVAFLGLDCRTERMRDEILSEHTYDKIFERCRREIVYGETKHLIVLLGVPIAYPRLEWLENILTSRAMDPLKAISRMGLLGNLTNKFDGDYEILDDLDDHWTAKQHKDERRWLIEELQDLAAEKSVRISILGGDVHLAAIGQFYSNKKLGIPKDQDYRYMPNIISSAIVNTPPSDMMADLINRRDKKVHHLDDYTDEDIIPMFTHDVDGKKRNNKKLLPRRNWCSISEYHPGTTPPPSPPLTPSEPGTPALQWTEEQGPRRSFSLGNSRPAQLLRRLSLSNREGKDRDELDVSLPYSQQRPLGDDPGNDSYFPPESGNTRVFKKPQRNVSAPPIPVRPTSQFHRRPTNMSELAVKKGGLPDTGGEISLEGGLDVRLNCEFKQGDPIGSTESYRLLVPALWHTGGTTMPAPQRRPSMLKRLSSLKANPFAAKSKEVEDFSDESETEHVRPAQFQPRPPAPEVPQVARAPWTSPSAVPAGPITAGPATTAEPANKGSSNVPNTRAFPGTDAGPPTYSVSVESLSQRPRRQSLLQRLGSLRDRLPQLNRQKHADDNYSEYTNDEYTPDDDAAMMRPGSMARQSRPPISGSVDSVSRKPRRPSFAERFGSIGRRLSQMGRRKEQDWGSEIGSYTASDTEPDTDHESDFIGSGDLSRPGRQPMLNSPPGSRGQPMFTPPGSRGQPLASPPTENVPPIAHRKPQQQSNQQQAVVVQEPQRQQQQQKPQNSQKTQAYRPTAPAGAPTRVSSQRAAPPAAVEEIPDPFKARPKLAMSPPPLAQQAQVAPGQQPQYASTYAGSTDAMVGSKQQQPSTRAIDTGITTTTKRSSTQRPPSETPRDSRRSGAVFNDPQPQAQPSEQRTPDNDDEEDEEEEEEDSELDSIDDLDSLKGAAKARMRHSKDMTEMLGPEAARAQMRAQAQAQVQAARSQSVRAPAAERPTGGAAPRRKDMSKFFGEDDPAEEQGMRRRVTDPGAGKRLSGGYSGVEAYNGSKKWWKLGK